ncbi:MAG: RDD family protein [Pseudolabrys sp.]
MNNNWYYSETGEQSHGPISIEDLGRILVGKNNSANFLVWFPGMPDWTRAGNVADLKRYFQQNAPPPLRAKPNDAVVMAPVQSTPSVLHPWRRYFARILDLYIFMLIFFFFLGVAFPELSATNQTRGTDYLYTLIGLAAYSVFETFCLNVFGTTFGKLLYGIRLETKAGDQIAFIAALKRSLSIWVRGLGLGIPIIALVTLVVAYRTLLKEGQTSWDRDFNFVVLHRDLSIFRWFVIAVAWLLLLSIWAILIAAGSR